MATPDARMTGAEIAFVRFVLGDNRKMFGARFGVSQSTVVRLEATKEKVSGPLIILINQIVEKLGLVIPDLDRIRAEMAVAGQEEDAECR